jgi:acyl-CoA synthetase (AMP-forming)/AMP-acid ligase II
MMQNLASNLRRVYLERPDAIAVVHDERRISYSELWKMSQGIMLHLRNHGFKAGERVSILLQNSPEYIASYYAILAMGGVVVALNTAAKQRDLSNWLVHSGSSWLIADSEHPELPQILADFNGRVLLIDDKNIANGDDLEFSLDNIIGDFEKEIEVNTQVKGNAPAAIIYTSGTTGSPKGVTLSHSNLINNTRSIIEYLGLGSTDSIVNVLPFYYSYGNSILHTHIAVGGTIVLANNMLFPKLILELIEKERVSGFSGVPSTYALLLNRTRMEDYDLSSLRYMTEAGGAMPPSNVSKLIEILPDLDIYIMYGQTEATARLSYLPPERLKEKIGSIGIAIPGVDLEIRDKQGRKVNEGTVGEIHAKGENIMLGYWSDEDRTRIVIENGWLKTGDLAHYDHEEFIYIVGRSSEMIKTGANRVSPKDVEEVISAIDGVEEVAVVGIPDEMLGQIIKAFIVKNENYNLKERDILAYCKKNLAIYKIPKHVEFIKEIPKTASGKVRRFLLNK